MNTLVEVVTGAVIGIAIAILVFATIGFIPGLHDWWRD